jgi:hypothetical protein
MDRVQAYQSRNLTESLVAFAQFVRQHGMNVGIQESQEALLAAQTGLLSDRSLLRHGLKALFTKTPEEGPVFEKLFALYWDSNPVDLKSRKGTTKVQGSFQKKANASVVMLGQGKNDSAQQEEAREVSGANATERLKKTDLSKLSTSESEELEKIAEKLFRQMAARLRRRMKHSNKQGQLQLRSTIRKSLCNGGEPMELVFRKQTPKKQRLIVLLDVSGSMDKYSFFLLRFICALKSHFRQLEAYVFSTRLKRISKALQLRRIDEVLRQIGEQSDHWSSGTKIGECLQQFNEKYGKRQLNGSPTVIILSDGLDTGEISLLAGEMKKIQRRSKKLIWLNPLKGSRDYSPEARGMKAALPSIDDFRTAHNIESLLELENILLHV